MFCASPLLKYLLMHHTYANQMEALHDVVKAGWVRYIGMSSCYAWQCESHLRLYQMISVSYKFLSVVHAMQSTIYIFLERSSSRNK